MARTPGVLWHYTSGSVLKSMVNTPHAWATEISYMNDSSEYRATFEVAVDLTDRVNTLRTKAEAAPELRAAMSRFLRLTHSLSRVFVFCLSEDGDDLTQWRGYTTSGDGYALGFSQDYLQGRAQQDGWRLVKCDYTTEARDSQVFAIVASVFDSYLAQRSAGDAAVSAETSVGEMTRRLAEFAPIFKHAAFVGENEWRLISPVLDYTQSQFNFRPGRTTLIPYLDFPLSDSAGHLAVESVTVGPGPTVDPSPTALVGLAQSALHTYLYQYLHRDGLVRRSELPYRVNP